MFPQVDKHGPTFEIADEKGYVYKGKMLYLIAHLFLNSQSKNSNFFPLPELHEAQFKKKEWSSGDENVFPPLFTPSPLFTPLYSLPLTHSLPPYSLLPSFIHSPYSLPPPLLTPSPPNSLPPTSPYSLPPPPLFTLFPSHYSFPPPYNKVWIAHCLITVQPNLTCMTT